MAQRMPQIALFAFLSLWGFSAYGQRSVSDGEDIGIIIVGTISHTNNEENVALVKEVDSGRVLAVKPNFTLLKKYRIKQVTAKYILLVEGTKEHLVFQNKFAGEFISTSPSPQPLAGLSPLGNAFAENGFERKDGKINVTENYVNKILTEDFSQVLMQATALPRMQDGKIIGFTILQIDAGSIFDKAGLRDNDVITSINGKSLNSVAGAIQVLKSMRGQKQMQIELLRGSSKEQLEINVH